VGQGGSGVKLGSIAFLWLDGLRRQIGSGKFRACWKLWSILFSL